MERILKALGNKRRLATVRFIKKEKEAAVGEIADEINLSMKATSKHLGILFGADILEREQRGLQGFYRLSDHLSELTRRIISLL